jgi:hypothetical protein
VTLDYRALIVGGAAIAFGALAAGCAAQASPFKGRAASETRLPSQQAELPYRFTIDGFQIDASSADLTTEAAAFDHKVEEGLGEDERWLAVSVTVEEIQGRERMFPWITMVRLRTALGMIVNAPHVLSARPAPADNERLAANEKQEMKFFFRVKRGDFPVQLIFADGAAAPLGE